MTRSLPIALGLTLLLAACESLDRAPGPELDSLTQEIEGTLIVLPYLEERGGDEIVLVDLPSGREREVELEHTLIRCGGLNERGEFVYARRIHAGNSPSGIWRGLVGETIAGSKPEDEYRLQCVDLVHSTERELALLEGPPRLMSLAPRGDLLIVTHYADGGHPGSGVPTEVRAYEISTGARRDIAHRVGEVFACDWMPDGRVFALSGSAGGELFDALTLASISSQSAPFGLFTPDGSAYLVPRSIGYSLVDLESGKILIEQARLPWPMVRGAPASERGFALPFGLGGPRHALYLALPTEGKDVGWTIAHQQTPRFEFAAIKVADLREGTYATVRNSCDGVVIPAWSPVRLELLQP